MRLPKHRKVLGELAEGRFIPKALGLGFRVAKPFGDSAPYDFVVEKNGRLQRVQVKSSARLRANGSFQFNTSISHCARLYTKKDIDFIVAYIFPHDAWYVIPVEALGRREGIYVRPHRHNGLFEPFREAWHLLWQM